MSFPLGKPIFVLMILAFVSGSVVLFHRPPARADLVLWCFADAHARTYREPSADADSLVDQFHRATGVSVQVDLLSLGAEDIRLQSMFNSRATGGEVPDACELESGSIGQFFRPPVDQIGLLPLNDYLQRSGEMDRILASRLASWSKRDPRSGKLIVFGIPHDVHPMTITYRKDLFDEAGVDPTLAKTWAEFQTACLELQRYRAAHGRPDSRALELPMSTPDMLMAMLLQRHINVVDPDNHLFLNNPIVAQTVAFYAQLVVGPNAIGADVSTGAGFGTDDLSQGNVCAMCTPDWRAGYVKTYAPKLGGKLRMRALPRFDPDDAPTSSNGGTMIGIPRTCPHPDEAWKLIELLYLSPAGNAARVASGSGILPPVPDLWADPVYHQPDPYYGGQKVYELYVDLARQIPPRYMTPYTTQAAIALVLVLHRAEDYVDGHGTTGLEEACAGWLAEAQTELQRRIEFSKLE